MPEPVIDTAAAAPAQPAAVSQPAAAAPPESNNPLERMSAADRQTFMDTGKMPGPIEGKPAPAAPAAGDDAPAVDAKGQPVTDAQGKPLSRRQQENNRRIQEAIDRGVAEARARAEAAERRAAELEAKHKPTEPAQPAEPAAAATEEREPVLDDFLDQPDPYLALTKALVKWERAQERKAEEAQRSTQTAQERAQQAAHQRFTSYQERETAFKAVVPDFDAKTEAVRHALDLRSPLTAAMLESPVAPQLILHLAEHPEDFQRIGALGVTNPAAALRELGKLEAKYETPAASAAAPAAPAAKHVTSAPAPGTFLGSQPAPAADATKAAVSRGDFLAFEQEETAKDLARAGRR